MSVAGPGCPLASVIVPCHGQLEYTRQCVAALHRHTRPPWELVAVDNASPDATAEYLRGVRDASPRRVEVITNLENRGFPAACNQGIAAARGEYVVLLNNDAVVTDAWLDMLVALAESNPAIAMAGPMSNYASPPQLIDHAAYPDLDAMHRFASAWRDGHRGQWFEAPKLSGFCLLIRRAALETVGGLDERFGLGLFDDDLALRMRHAGYKLAVARDLFVHHHGSRTFAGAGIDAAALLGENRARFEAKWGEHAGLPGRAVGLGPWQPAPASPAAGRPRVSLTMIVRDEERNLPACLASAAGLFDETVVVDTGSKDRTVEVARSFGARVFEFPWVDDFAAARNAALGHATGDYAFWLDADDVIEPHQRERLRALIAQLGEVGPTAYVVRCSCDPGDGAGGATVVDHVRLFPRRPGVRWSYRVHEQILPALREAGIPVRWSEVTVRHTGYADGAVRARKLDRDRAILEAELARDPDEPFVLFNLGSISIECRRWPEAIDRLRRSLARSAPSDSITRKTRAMIARAHQAIGEISEAVAACDAGLAVDPDDAELLFRRAVLHRTSGEPAQAEERWRKVLTLRPPERFSSVDTGIFGHLTRRNLAALAEERRDLAEAARLWAEVRAECPGDAEAEAARRRLAGHVEVPPILVGV